MKQHGIWNQVVAVALAAAFIFAPNLSAGQDKGTPSGKSQPTTHNSGKPSQTTAGRENSSGGPKEGIKVHGHWTIVVRNADGSVASRNEFENALFLGDGDVFLAAVLSRNTSVGHWGVGLDGPSASEPCNSGGSRTLCEIIEPNGNQLSGAEIFQNLTMQTGTPATTVVLTGSAKSANGGQIASVGTYIGVCPATVAPSACSALSGGSIHGLTTHGLATPIAVQAGQTIDVNVVLSFT